MNDQLDSWHPAREPDFDDVLERAHALDRRSNWMIRVGVLSLIVGAAMILLLRSRLLF
ncbi:MAG: hypothetical protein ACREP9_03135 [Candidatus Dormibacteraceae bacterium]